MFLNKWSVVTDAVNPVIESLEERRLMSAVLSLQNLQGLPFNDRLVFNRIQIPDALVPNSTTDTASIRLLNTGDQPLTLSKLTLNGPWVFEGAPVTGYDNTIINAGSSLDVTLRFTQSTVPPHSVNQTNYTTGPNDGAAIAGSLTIDTNDPTNQSKVVTLAGYWQKKSENNNEPNLTTIVNTLLGYGTVIASPYRVDLNQGSTTPTYYGEEVVSSSWAAVDGSQPVVVRQLAAYHTEGNSVRTSWYLSSDTISRQLFSSLPNQGQRLLPTNASGGALQGSFSPRGNFGFRVDNEYSDDAINVAKGNMSGGGHHMRFYPLRDRQGNYVANSWLMAMDYAVLQTQNFDFQDNVYLVTNMRPTNVPPAPTNLTATDGSSVKLDWTGVSYSSLAGYNVYRSSSPNGNFTKLNGSTPISATEFVDSSAPGGVTSYYQVRAVDSLSTLESTPASTLANTPGGPVANADFFDVNAGKSITINVISNDTDATGSIVPTSVAITQNPTHGTVSVDANTGLVTYSANTGYSGTDVIKYQVTDSNGAVSSPATVTITVVNPTSAPPVSFDDTATTLFNTPVTINVLSNDTTGGTFVNDSILFPTAPSHGLVTLNTDGTVTYTPNDKFVGADSFTYTVADSNGKTTDPKTVSLTVGVRIGLGTGITKSATWADLSGTQATVTLNKGFADLFFLGDGLATVAKGKTTLTGTNLRIADIVGTGTTVSSVLGFTAKGGSKNFTVGGIEFSSPLAKISGAVANVSGPISITGLGTLIVRNLANSNIDIGTAGAKKLTFLAGVVDDSVLTSQIPIGTLKVTSWINTENGNIAIGAPSISSLYSKGDFDPNLRLTSTGVSLASARIVGKLGVGFWEIAGNARSIVANGVNLGWGATVAGTLTSFRVLAGGLPTDLTAGAIGSLYVKGDLTGDLVSGSARSIKVIGNISGSLIDITNGGAVTLGTVVASQTITNSTIQTAGNLGTVVAAGLSGSTINAGVSGNTTLALASNANIGTGTISSIRLTNRKVTAFSNSSILARTIKSASLGLIGTDNAGVTEGLAGVTYRSVVGLFGGKTLSLGAKQLADEATLATYVASKGVSFGDYTIRILA